MKAGFGSISVLLILSLSGVALAVFPSPDSYAPDSGSSNIQGALNELQDTTRTFLAVSIVIESAIGIVLLAVAGFVYFKKLKNVPKKETLWLALCAVSGIIGLFFILAAVLGLVAYIATPAITGSLVAS